MPTLGVLLFIVRGKLCTFAVRLFGESLRIPGTGVLIAVSLAGHRG